MKEVNYLKGYKKYIDGPEAGRENLHTVTMRGWIDCARSIHGYRRYYLTTGGLRVCLNSIFKYRDPDPEEVIMQLRSKNWQPSELITNTLTRKATQGHFSENRLNAMLELAGMMGVEDIVFAE